MIMGSNEWLKVLIHKWFCLLFS